MGASTTFTIFLLVLLNVICYSSTVDGYFLADDFSHVSYLYQVFHGHPELLLQNFWTNWMQTEGTRFYRPVISLTLALDYLLWSGSAKGFHLSNLIFQILSSIGVFLVSKRLFLTDLRGKQKTDGDSGKQLDTRARLKYKLSPDHVYTINFTSLLAASIFAVHPLHPEVVSWIIGRVDSVCTTFYLFSLWLFLISIQTHNDRMAMRARYASLGLFALALGSKEMAVTLPPTLVLLLLFSNAALWQSQKYFCKSIQRHKRLLALLASATALPDHTNSFSWNLYGWLPGFYRRGIFLITDRKTAFSKKRLPGDVPTQFRDLRTELTMVQLSPHRLSNSPGQLCPLSINLSIKRDDHQIGAFHRALVHTDYDTGDSGLEFDRHSAKFALHLYGYGAHLNLACDHHLPLI